MSRSALGGFAQGLQQGMEFQQNRRRNKRIEKALDFELSEIERKQRGREAEAAAEGYTDTDYNRNLIMDDPYEGLLSRMFSGARNMFRRTPQAIDPGQLQAPEANYMDYSTEYRGQFADGGEVDMDDPRWPRLFDEQGNRRELTDEERMVRSYGPDFYVTEAEAAENRDRRTRGDYYRTGPVQRTRAGVDRQAINASRTGGGLGEYGSDMARRAGAGQPNARAAGEEFRRSVGDTIGGAVDLGRGAVDAVGDFVEPVGDFLGGALGTPEAAAVQTSDVAAQPQPDAPAPTQGQTSRPPSAGGSGGVAPAGESGQAIPTQAAPQRQGFDWSNVQAMPDDLPNMKVRDWQEYRRESVRALMMQGMNANEAHEQVTQMQQRGFLNNAQQALLFMQGGDVRSAALAMKAAYQYFPNGADVKFGMTQDSQGQPALVAMGRDEETGEQSGQPMLINSERLAVMMENMSNPSAFRTWTKDWRTEEFERQIFEEYTKPIGKADAETRRINARAGELNARSRAAGGSGGLRQSDLDRAYSAMNDLLSEMGLLEDVPAEDLSYLRQIAAIAYEQAPGNYLNTVEQIATIYRQGGAQAVDAAIRGGQ